MFYCKRVFSLCLALLIAAMTLCAASCRDLSGNSPASPPETTYPLLSEKSFNANGEQESEDIYTYDADGNLTGCDYRLLGESKETGAYQYENGKPVRKTVRYGFDLSPEEKMQYVCDYTYDAGGLLTEIAKTLNGKYAGRISYMRSGSGKIKQVIYYDADNGFKGMVEHKYDTSGNCIEEKEYDARSIISRHIYQYDATGNVTECMVFNDRGFACTYRFAYGDSGELLTQSWEDENGNAYRVEAYDYDASGRKKTRTVTEDGKTVKITEYESYDDNGNCLREAFYDESRNPLGWREYTYGAEKIPVPAWEFSEHTFHGDFLVQSIMEG